jgi:hypothetical protein
MSTYAIPRASAPWVSGRIPTHSCARAAVRENRVSTWTNRAPRPFSCSGLAKATSLQRRPPRLEKRSTKGQHQLRPVEVVRRSPRDAVHQPHDRRGTIIVVVGDVVRRSEGVQELTPDVVHRAGAVPSQERQSLRPAGLTQGLETLCQKRDGPLRGDLPPLPSAPGTHTHHRRVEALGMIKGLHAGDPTRTEPATTHGVERIAADPDEASVYYPSPNAAPCRAHETRRGDVILDAWRPAQVRLRLGSPKDVLRLVETERRGGSPHGPQELASGRLHLHHPPAIDGTRRSPASARARDDNPCSSPW